MTNHKLTQTISLALFAVFIACCLSVNSLAQRGSQLDPSLDDDFGLRTKGAAIPDVDVVLKKKPGGGPAGNSRTDHNGNFNLGYLPPGIYSMTMYMSPMSADQFQSEMAKTYTDSRSNTASRAMVMLDGVKSMAVITSMEMRRNRFFGQVAPAFTQVYEIQFEVTGRQAVTGHMSIIIDEAGVK